MRLIILNCYSRNTLAAVNALPANWTFFAGATRKGRRIINPDRFLRSPRIKEVFRHADPQSDPAGFIDDLVAACQRFQADGILATGTAMTNALSRHKEEIAHRTPVTIMVEDYSKMERLTDKWTITQIASEVGVPVPTTIKIEGLPETLTAIETFPFPAVFKPRMSFGSIGLRFFDDRATFARFLADNWEQVQASKPILQQRIDGTVMDVNTCGRDGRALTLLSQRRVKTLYDFGGGGIVNITTREEKPKLYSKQILNFIKWNGPCQFEYIAGHNGDYYLIEANPKLWGTTYLTVVAGCNIVRQSVDVFMHNDELESSGEYEVGLLYRWIFPENVYNWVQKPRTIMNIKRRIYETFRSYGAKRSLHNLNLRDLPHLLGMVVNGTSLQ